MICKTELHRNLVCVTFVSECVKCEVCCELACIDLLLKQTFFFFFAAFRPADGVVDWSPCVRQNGRTGSNSVTARGCLDGCWMRN